MIPQFWCRHRKRPFEENITYFGQMSEDHKYGSET